MTSLLKISLALLLLTSSAQASFRGGYMNPQDLLISLNFKFQGLIVGYPCDQVNLDNRNSLGDINLQTGEPMNDAPGTTFLSMWDQCITSYFSAITEGNHVTSTDPMQEHRFERNAQISATNLIPSLYAPLLAQIDHQAETQHLNRLDVIWSFPFPQDPAQQKGLIAYWTHWALGTDEEILAYGRMQSPDQFRQDLFIFLQTQHPSTLLQASQLALHVLLKRDEFLLYY